MARPVRSIDDWRALSDDEREERSAALSAVQLARREELPLGIAAALRGTSLAAIYEWAPEAVRPGFVGIAWVTPRDSIWRLRPLYVDGRLDFVEVEGSDQAEQAEVIFDLQWTWIHGDRRAGSDLQRYRGASINGMQVETDLAALRRIAEQGDDPIDIYTDLLF